MKKLILLAVVILGFAATSFAQTTATASSTATIKAASSIVKNKDLVFGDIFPGADVGTVVLDATIGGGQANTSGAGTGTSASSGTAAQFTVTGGVATTTTSAITMSAGPILLTSAGKPSMSLSLTKSATVLPLTPPYGTGILYVGGTLTVGALQPAGVYSNTNGISVTVAF